MNFLYALVAQINGSGAIDGNWFMGLVMAVLGGILIMNIREIKSELKENMLATNQLKTDVAVIKSILGLKHDDDEKHLK